LRDVFSFDLESSGEKENQQTDYDVRAWAFVVLSKAAVEKGTTFWP
jgi:hypothetical protein